MWALGFQQPTHLSFDFQAKRLFLLDSAQKTQVIDLVERGKNYGGATTEGGNCSATKCDTSTSTRPIYSNAGPVIGGFVYTSDMRQGLKGSYVFAEGTSMTLSKLTYEGSAWKSSVVAPLPASVAALGKNERGDIYVATRDGAVSTVTP